MNWSHISQAVNDVFSLVLVARLTALRLHGVYRVFCVFVLVQLLGSGIAFLEELTPVRHPDYRLTWISLEAILWIASLGTVYALLRALLRSLPGILVFSRMVLNCTFLAATMIALWSAKAEYSASKASSYLAPLARAVGLAFILNRAICSAALVSLIAILLFVLWFPVQMPKNLAVFSVGFGVYFAATVVSWLAWSFWSGATIQLVDNITMVVLSICYAYWAIFITAEGEAVPVRMGHSWHLGEQQRLIGQLETMNASLLRAARR